MANPIPSDASHPVNLPTIAPPKAKKSIFRYVKISRIFRSIYYTVCFWKKRYRLQPKDIRLIKHSSYQFKTAQTKKNSVYVPSSGHTSGILPFINLDHPKNFDVPPSEEYDSSLKQMRDFLGTFATDIFECFYEKHAQEYIDNSDKLFQILPNKLKQIAKFLVQVNKNSKPIFKLLEEKKNPLIDRLDHILNKNKGEIDSSIEHIFQWLTDGVTKESILTLLKKRLKMVNISESANLEEQYINPMLNWCFSSNHKGDALDPAKCNQMTANAVLEELILILFECKIDTYFQLIKDTLGEQKFPQLLRAMFSKNIKKSTDIVTDQLAHLIHHADYTANFALAEETFSQHVDDFLTAKTALGEGVDKVTSTNKTTVFWKEFGKQGSCHPTVLAMIKAYSEDALDLASSHEMKYLSSVADRLMKLLCPPYVAYTAEGFIVERNGLAFLWDQFVITPEFAFLLKKGIQVIQQIVSPEIMKSIENVQKSGIAFFEEILTDYANKLIKKQIIKRLKDIVDRITNPKRRDELLALLILPQISQLILYAYIRLVLSSPENIKAIAELFEKLGNSDSDSVSENRLLAIKTKFKNLINPTLNDIQNVLLKEHEIGSAQFDEQYTQIIEDIRKSWLQCPDDSAQECLTKYFSSPDVKKNEIYGNLIIKLVFEVGKLNSYVTKTLAPLVKDNISMRVAKTLHSITSTHQRALSAIIGASSKSYGTKEKVNELLFGQPSPLSDTKREIKLQKELNLISLLTHKFITFSAGGVGGFLVPVEAEINKAIQNIYYGILGDPLIFKSIIYKVQDIALDVLSKTQETIQHQKDILEAKKINATIPNEEENSAKNTN